MRDVRQSCEVAPKLKSPTDLFREMLIQMQPKSFHWPVNRVLEYVSDAIQAVSLSGEILYVNASWRQILGYQPQDVASLNWFDVVHPDSRDRLQSTLKSLQTNQQAQKIDLILRSKQVETIPVTGVLDYGTGPQGETIIWCLWQIPAPNCDLSRQREHGSGDAALAGSLVEQQVKAAIFSKNAAPFPFSQEASDQSEIQLQHLVANIPGMIFQLQCSVNRDTFTFSYVSPGCFDVFGVEPRTFYENSEALFRCIPHDSRWQFRETLNRSAQQCCPWSWEGQIKCLSGDSKWVQVAAHPQRRTDGGILWDGVLMDITSRKQTEERLHLLESAITNAKDSILITEAEPIDQPGPRIIYANPAFRKNTGYSLEEVLGETPRILQGPKSDRATLDTVKSALNAWQPVEAELINYRKDGTEFWVDMIIVPIVDANGWCTHWVSIQRDITERKQLEQELRNALNRERELNDLKSRFISTTSHEFRTPLAAIMSSVEILDYFDNSETERQELFKQIYASIQHLTMLMDDVLFIGRTESGRLELDCIDLDVEAFCRDIFSEAERSLGKHHRFSFICEGMARRGYLDPKVLRQTLSNLLSNAVKYSAPGSLITMVLDFRPDNAVRMQFRDQGIGIPLDDQPHLFDFFHRGSNVGTISGTGLGLAIVKKGVDLHGGDISVESQPNQGTTITLTLPLDYYSYY